MFWLKWLILQTFAGVLVAWVSLLRFEDISIIVLPLKYSWESCESHSISTWPTKYLTPVSFHIQCYNSTRFLKHHPKGINSFKKNLWYPSSLRFQLFLAQNISWPALWVITLGLTQHEVNSYWRWGPHHGGKLQQLWAGIISILIISKYEGRVWGNHANSTHTITPSWL